MFRFATLMLSLRQSPGGLEDGAPGYGETRIQGRGGEELPTALPMEEGGSQSWWLTQL